MVWMADTDAAGVPVTVDPPLRLAAVVAVVAELAVHAVHVPVRFVITPLAGVPRAGVIRVGDVAATGEPVPVVAVKLGAAVDPVKFPNAVFAATLESVNVKAGVVVAVATDVVNNGDRFPEENDVTVPAPPPPPKHEESAGTHWLSPVLKQ